MGILIALILYAVASYFFVAYVLTKMPKDILTGPVTLIFAPVFCPIIAFGMLLGWIFDAVT